LSICCYKEINKRLVSFFQHLHTSLKYFILLAITLSKIDQINWNFRTLLKWMNFKRHNKVSNNSNLFWTKYLWIFEIYHFLSIWLTEHARNRNFHEKWFIIAYKFNTSIKPHLPWECYRACDEWKENKKAVRPVTKMNVKRKRGRGRPKKEMVGYDWQWYEGCWCVRMEWLSSRQVEV